MNHLDNTKTLRLLTIVLFIFIGTGALFSQDEKAIRKAEKKAMLQDTLDGNFDFSRFLIDSKGFLPIPLIITEPALGNIGGVLALTFLSQKEIPEGQSYVAPDITASLGMYTANDSWAAAGGRLGSFPKKGIKYRGFTGFASLNLSFYRDIPQTGEQEYKFNISALPVLLSMSKSLPNSDVYLGVQYNFAKTTVEPLFEFELPDWVNETDLENNTGALGLFADWDRRDNFFTANKGTILHVLYSVDDKWTGSDYDYQRLIGFLNWFYPIKAGWISGLRFETQHVFDDPPFYLLPSLNMRGVPVARYQGATTVLMETEQRFDFNLRWSMVAFAGVGKAIMRDEDFGDVETVYNFGTGFRYLIARAFGIRGGIDIARGPDNWAWYITFGHNWNR